MLVRNSTRSNVPIRFQVTAVINDAVKQQILLDLNSAISINESIDRYRCILEGFWFLTKFNIQPNDFVNVIDAKVRHPDHNSPFVAVLIIDNNDGLLVLNPDVLISTTILMSASYCMRQSWLSRIFDAYGEGVPALLIGTIVHELFQESLKRRLFSVAEIENFFKTDLLNDLTLELYSVGMSLGDITAEITPYIKSISKWLMQYTDRNAIGTLFSIERVHGIENSIWSTKHGLIGKIDLSLEVNLNLNQSDTFRSRSLIPLELKTGRHTFSNQHMGQVILYSFIMAEKYPHMKLTDGFLLYLKDEANTKCVKSNHNIFRDLIIHRNNFVQYFTRKNSSKDVSSLEDIIIKGPETVESERICKRCEHLLDCSLMYKCFDKKYLENQNFDEFATQNISHLGEDDLRFFTRLVSLLEIESQHELNKQKANHFWNLRSEDCERSNIGLSKTQIRTQDEQNITFERSRRSELREMPSKLLSLNDDQKVRYAQLEGRRVVISEELISDKKTFELYGKFCKQLCVAIGTVIGFGDDGKSINVMLEKSHMSILPPNGIYRLDFLQNLNHKAMSINFANILRLMSPNDERCRELRDIVIRGHFPRHNVNTCNVSSISRIYQSSIVSTLNVQQRKAVIGVLRTRCSLILGSPGSGKTQTIVALIQTLIRLGYTALVTSFTHIGVDNILLKLMKANQLEPESAVDFLRLGNKSRIHAELKEYSDYHRTSQWLKSGDVAALDAFYSTVPVVASTCLGVASHPIFAKRKFDFCILDEASQVYLASCLGPIFFAKNFILVGDQKQLPPVIVNQFARKQGLEESLFGRLLSFVDKQNLLGSNNSSSEEDDGSTSEQFEDYLCKQKVNQIDAVRVFPLFIQYRMNCVIMNLANRLTYSGKLKCANQAVELGTLNHFLPNGRCIGDHRAYLEQSISPTLENAVIFLDTAGIASAMENVVGDNDETIRCSGSTTSIDEGAKQSGFVYNDFEAHFVIQLVHSLLAAYESGGLAGAEIGVISPFQRQVKRIRELFGAEYLTQRCIEINTVDQYQGRDKEVIIYSCVKSHFVPNDCKNTEYPGDVSQSDSPNENGSAAYSELLKDERRLNVAITRAKKKLIIIGNRRTLSHYAPFNKMFSVLRSTQYVQLSAYNCDDVFNSLA